MIRDVVEREYAGKQVFSAPVEIHRKGGVIDVGETLESLGAGKGDLRDAVEAIQAKTFLVGIEAGQEVTLRGDVHLEVVDLAGDAVEEPALLRVWIGTTAFGAPSATDNTVAIETGTAVQAVLANAHYLILTDAEGHAEIQLTLAGAGDRFVMVALGDRVVASNKIEIAVIE